ncbi:hypothetical protein V496_04093 [Pseudogymnoascus sp. VKM F-4515 (FW-2607)]|nr:hypothetical protein V496_04093 [Pseudogymnoascus sp. VKM F-4515 (FW-2607)]KFY98924.1 hypothetical protein V498_01151 [Pseudogymnoascus sp. VKM F-4517 (FW-2822)]
MPVDFQLSPSEAGIRNAAAGFAATVLKDAKKDYIKFAEHHQRFQSTKPIYEKAVQGGLIKGQVPAHLGGTGGSLVESAILVEEMYAVEPAASLTIFATGLGLTPLVLTGKPEHKEFLAPFLSGEGAPLASLVFSEPGGVANFLEKGAPGLNTTAEQVGDEWVINGEKLWATNSAGWDFGGADLQCVVCRTTTPSSDEPADALMIIMVTTEDVKRNNPGAFSVLRHVSTAGHTACSGPHIKYTNMRVPAKNVLCAAGTAAPIVLGSFDLSAVLVGAMGVGIMRAAFDAALEFAKGDNRRGAVPLLERQSVADLMINIKMQTEACRALTWKAASSIQNGPGDYNARRELALSAKVYCSDAAVKACIEAINVVGVNAYDADRPFADLLNNAMVLPIFDGGNVGIRRRHMQELMLSKDYDAWASTYGPSKPFSDAFIPGVVRRMAHITNVARQPFAGIIRRRAAINREFIGDYSLLLAATQASAST